MAMNERLTDVSHWDEVWSDISLPMEVGRSKGPLAWRAIVAVLDEYLPKKAGLDVLEIGGAPGQVLAYLSKAHGYSIHCLDYSPAGCEKTRENFALLGVPGKTYCGDVFSDDLNLPTFDVVYSLGFIEHFSDLTIPIERHLKLLKPGGILVVTIPNYQGINAWVMRRLAPTRLAKHNLQSMDIALWKSFEDKFGLITLHKGYIGGLWIGVLATYEGTKLIPRIAVLVLKAFLRLISPLLTLMKNFNSKYFSPCAVAVYQAPAA